MSIFYVTYIIHKDILYIYIYIIYIYKLYIYIIYINYIYTYIIVGSECELNSWPDSSSG